MGEKRGDVHFGMAQTQGIEVKQPKDFAGLKKLISNESLRADLLICGGDLGDNAQPDGIRYAWQAVNEIGALLKASQIVATVGNHDMDSRQLFNKYDPREALQSLSPPFPLPDTALNDLYWSQHFAVLRR